MTSFGMVRKLTTGAAAVAVACVGVFAAAPAATAAPTTTAAASTTASQAQVPYASLEVEQPLAPDASRTRPSWVGERVPIVILVNNVGNQAFDRIEVTYADSSKDSRGALAVGGHQYYYGAEHVVTAEDLARGYFTDDLYVRGYIGGTYTEKSIRVAEFVSAPSGPATLKASANGKYVVAEHEGAGSLIANRSAVGLWEQFTVLYNNDNTVSLQAGANGKWVTAEDAGASALIANRTAIGPWEKFSLIRNADHTVSLKSVANGKYVTAEDGGASALIANRTAIGPWEKFTLGGH